MTLVIHQNPKTTAHAFVTHQQPPMPLKSIDKVMSTVRVKPVTGMHRNATQTSTDVAQNSVTKRGPQRSIMIDVGIKKIKKEILAELITQRSSSTSHVWPLTFSKARYITGEIGEKIFHVQAYLNNRTCNVKECTHKR